MYSLWTYVHRVLHLLGVAAVDTEELALLSGHLVRIRTASRRGRGALVLALAPDPLHPDEPVGWVAPHHAPTTAQFFFLHFDSTDDERPDRARIATAAPSSDSPRAWLILDHSTGVITLTASELKAAVFDVVVSSSSSGANSASVSLLCPCSAGRYLSVHSPSRRARVCALSATDAETFLINNVPLPPTLELDPDAASPYDFTMAEAYRSTRVSPVRIQSYARNCFLASSPGAPLASAGKKESGWDGFTLEYDSETQSARVRDSRGLYLAFGSDLRSFAAMGDAAEGGVSHGGVAGGDKNCGATWNTSCRRPERFAINLVGDDDRVTLRSRKGYMSCRRAGTITIAESTTPGRHEHFYLRQALPSMMDQSSPRVRLRVLAGGVRELGASVIVPANADIAYDVLADYDGFSEFIEDAAESRILERRDAHELTVLMVQSHTFLVLTLHLSMVLDVTEDPTKRVVTMNMKRGLGVKTYKGTWHAVVRSDGKCLVCCSLLAAPAVPAPGFLIDGVMAHAISTTMEQIRTECIRRSTLESAHQSEPVRQREALMPAGSAGSVVGAES